MGCGCKAEGGTRRLIDVNDVEKKSNNVCFDQCPRFAKCPRLNLRWGSASFISIPGNFELNIVRV